MKHNYAKLMLAIASTGLAYEAQAAALDRSGQDVSALLQQGTYAEVVYTHIDANISGNDNTNLKDVSIDNTYTQGRATGDVANAYDFFRYGVKADVNDSISVAVIYDEPFGASVQFSGDNNFVSGGYDSTFRGAAAARSQKLANLPADVRKQLVDALASNDVFAEAAARTAMWDKVADAPLEEKVAKELGVPLYKAKQIILDERQRNVLAIDRAASQAEADKGQGTSVDIRTNNITTLADLKLGGQKNIHLYGGVAAQRLKGEVHLRGVAYGPATGYNAQIAPDQSYGWVAGAAYTKPEIALKAALTYRSPIKHKTDISEEMPVLGAMGKTVRDFSVTLPESYNLDFQTGVNPTTLVMAKVRYVPWKKFSINPPTYGDTTERVGPRLAIVSYDKDQWNAEIGVGKKLSDKLSVSGNVGWDSGAGNPTSTLGPVDGYYSVGLGAKYNVTPEFSLSAGGKYLKFGDATAQLPNHKVAGKFSKNDGYIVGAKLAYQHK